MCRPPTGRELLVRGPTRFCTCRHNCGRPTMRGSVRAGSSHEGRRVYVKEDGWRRVCLCLVRKNNAQCHPSNSGAGNSAVWQVRGAPPCTGIWEKNKGNRVADIDTAKIPGRPGYKRIEGAKPPRIWCQCRPGRTRSGAGPVGLAVWVWQSTTTQNINTSTTSNIQHGVGRQ